MGDASEGADSDGAPTPVELTDEQNYHFAASLDIPTVETASGVDLTVCWDQAVTDFRCHAMDPMLDVDNLALLRLRNLSELEIEERLSLGTLLMSDIDGYLSYTTDHSTTCTPLSSLSLFGTAVDITEEYVASADRRYMLRLSEGTQLNAGTQTMLFVQPTEDSTVTEVHIPAGCGFLDFTADLVSSLSVPLPDEPPWEVDWGGLTRDGQGTPINFAGIDHLLIGFYAGLTAEALQAQILDLEQIATAMWSLDLTGAFSADLSRATHVVDGTPFTGFAPGGVWILALMCSQCQNPAPIFLTIVEPSGGRAVIVEPNGVDS